jgi:hypothetical protein
VEKAKQLIADMLAEGPRLSSDIKAEGERKRISWRAIERARKLLGRKLCIQQQGRGFWWSMPRPAR